MDLMSSSNQELLDGLRRFLSGERTSQVQFLRHLAEVDRRKLALDLGFTSSFAYLTQHFKLSNASAFRRLTTARLMVRYPIIGRYLARGELCLTTLCYLREVLDEPERRDQLDLLRSAAGKTEEEVRRLAAALRPVAAPPDLIRKLPRRARSSAGTARAEPAIRQPVELAGDCAALPSSACESPRSGCVAPPGRCQLPPGQSPPRAPMLARPDGGWEPCITPAGAPQVLAITGDTAGSTSGTEVSVPAANATVATATREPATIRPISAELSVFRMTVGQEFLDTFRQLRDALAHKIPGGRAEDILLEACRIALASQQRRRQGAPLRNPGAGPARSRAAASSTAAAPSPAPRGESSLGGPGESSWGEPGELSPASPGESSPRSSTASQESSRRRIRKYIPVIVRREVWRRDQGRCTFVGLDGRRCESTRLLQLHHRLPHARNGADSIDNFTLHCAAHNRRQAELDFGESMPPLSAGPGPGSRAPAPSPTGYPTRPP